MFGGVVAGLGLANWPGLLVSAVAVVVLAMFNYVFKREPDRRLILFFLITIAVATLCVITDLSVRGHWINNPYGSAAEKGFKTIMPYSGLPGFSHPILIGLLGSVFSFGKSVFIFNPFLIFLFTEKYKYKIYMLSFFVVTLLVYSHWWAWYGGFSFGTRFYTFAVIPSMYLYTQYLLRKDAAYRLPGLLVIPAAIWVSLCGRYFGLGGVMTDVCSKDNYALEAFCWYVPEFSPVINPLITHDIRELLGKLSGLGAIYFVLVVLIFISLFRNPEILRAKVK